MGERSRAQARAVGRKSLHEDGRARVAVPVMLGAISPYVRTLDDAVEPVEGPSPAAAP